jgi:uncharacterized membrane protein
VIALLRLLLAVAYPLLAHAASTRGSPVLAALALADIALIVLLPALACRRAWAWLTLLASAAGLAALAQSRYALLPLLAPPVLVTALVAWLFARTLVSGRVPLLTRVVAALHRQAPAALAPELLAYTRTLTGVWAALLCALALANLLLALLVVPGGGLAQLGIAAPWSIPRAQWSWFANGLNYGLLGGLFCGEYLWRQRRFPQRPYRDFPDFLQRMAALGPGFWRDALH